MQVSIEKQSDGTYIAYNTTGDMVTLLGSGNTVQEAKDDFKASFEAVKNSYENRGDAVPSELLETVEFKFDLASLFEYYSCLNIGNLAKFVGINPSLMRQYKQGNTYISEAQLLKIQAGINRLGAELERLRLV